MSADSELLGSAGCQPAPSGNLPDANVAQSRGATRKRLIYWPPSPDALLWRIVRPVGMAALFLTLWGLAVRWSHSDLFPTPGSVVRGIIELGEKGLLLKYIVASLFRVTWGFTLALVLGIP